MDLVIEIGLMAIAFVAFSTWLQRRFIDTLRVAELQQLINQKTKELTELHKSNASDEAKAAKASELQAHTMESVRHMTKPLLVALPLFLVFYYLIFPALFPSSPKVTVYTFTMDYRTYFIAVSFVAGLFLQLYLQAQDKAKLLKRQQGEGPAVGKQA